GVASRDDVGLHGRLGAGRRVARGQDAFVEGARGALAVVAADAEDDRALRRVAGRDVLGAVIAVAVARGDVDAVDLRAVDHGRRRGRVREGVRAAGGAPAGA